MTISNECVFVRRIQQILIYGPVAGGWKKWGMGERKADQRTWKNWLNWWFKWYARLLKWIQIWNAAMFTMAKKSLHHKLKIPICSLDDFAISAIQTIPTVSRFHLILSRSFTIIPLHSAHNFLESPLLIDKLGSLKLCYFDWWQPEDYTPTRMEHKHSEWWHD